MTERTIETESGELPPGYASAQPERAQPRRRPRRQRRPHDHELRTMREALTSLVEALDGDEPEGLFDAYDAACAVLGIEPAVLGDWVERAAELRAIETRR